MRNKIIDNLKDEQKSKIILILEVLKDYGRQNNKVWLYNTKEQKKVELKYDKWRRYYISNPMLRNEKQRIHRVYFNQFVKAMCEYLEQGYDICF